MTFGERLTQLRKEYGYATRNEFAEKLGIPSTTLRNYETDVREPGHTFLKQISEFFNVSVDYLLCLTDEREVLNSFRLRTSEQSMIENYRDLDDHGKDMVNTVLSKELERSKAEKEKEQTQQTSRPAPTPITSKPEPDHLMVNAAHEIEGATEEEKARVDAMMDDDSLWERKF